MVNNKMLGHRLVEFLWSCTGKERYKAKNEIKSICYVYLSRIIVI